MYITPVTCSNIYNPQNRKIQKANFTAHPDFYKFNSTQSCFFRRGVVSLVNERGYAKLENLFFQIFSKPDDTPKEMLIVGLAHSQEPFSYLASIKGILGNHSLNKNVDLYTVELDSAPELSALKYDSFCDLRDYEHFPKYAGKSFVKDTYSNRLGQKSCPEILDLISAYIYKQTYQPPKPRYRVNDEIFNFLWNTYTNPQKSKWETPVQEAILEYPDNKFKIISANNVLQYIMDDKLYERTLVNMKRILKTDGYIITDPYDFLFNPYPDFMKNMEKVSAGVFRKLGE